VQEDIDIMQWLADLINKHIPDYKYLNLPAIVNEFERSIKKEMNYYQERMNLKKFYNMFEDDEEVYVPKVFDKYSTERILTMEFINGTKISALAKSKKHFDKKLIAKRGAESFFKQVLVYSFFHADPHPGNIFILKDNVICFLDFGMMGHFDKDYMGDLARLFVFIIDYHVNGLINQLTNMGYINETVDIKSLKYDVMDIMDLYHGAELKDIKWGNLQMNL